MDIYNLKIIGKGYLGRRGVQEKQFKNNMPGIDWANSFLTRHKDYLTKRVCQNITGISPKVINIYFDNLEKSLEGIAPANIMNFDETNLSDDPGQKRLFQNTDQISGTYHGYVQICYVAHVCRMCRWTLCGI